MPYKRHPQRRAYVDAIPLLAESRLLLLSIQKSNSILIPSFQRRKQRKWRAFWCRICVLVVVRREIQWVVGREQRVPGREVGSRWLVRW
jgi:hypothetical protein